MFWDRSQIAIAFDKEYILYCVNLAFGHDPKTSFVEVPEICLGTTPNDHLGPIRRIIQSCFRARSQNFPRELFKLVLGIIPIFVLYPSCEVFKLVLGRIPKQLLKHFLGTSFWTLSKVTSSFNIGKLWVCINIHYVLRIYPYFCFRTIT